MNLLKNKITKDKSDATANSAKKLDNKEELRTAMFNNVKIQIDGEAVEEVDEN